MMLVIQAKIMKLEIAMAPFAAGAMPKGANQIESGTATQTKVKKPPEKDAKTKVGTPTSDPKKDPEKK